MIEVKNSLGDAGVLSAIFISSERSLGVLSEIFEIKLCLELTIRKLEIANHSLDPT